MTMREIRKGFVEKRRFLKAVGLGELVGYVNQLQAEAEILWKEGCISSASDDFLAYANGYQINTGDYEGIEIRQTYGMRSVKATKEVALEIAEAILNG